MILVVPKESCPSIRTWVVPSFIGSRFPLVTHFDQEDSKKCDTRWVTVQWALLSWNVADNSKEAWASLPEDGRACRIGPSWWPAATARYAREAILDYPDHHSRWVTPCGTNPRTTQLIPNLSCCTSKCWVIYNGSCFKPLSFGVLLYHRG